jgi:hypothetical protein
LFQLSIESGKGYDSSLGAEESLHEPKVNIELAVAIMTKLVKQNGRIAGKTLGKWQGGARYWSVLRGDRDYTAKALASIKAVNAIPEPPVRDNADTDKPDDGGEYPKYDRNPKARWYPLAIKTGAEMRTRGKYSNGFPKGMVVHFTAGRSRGGVLRNKKTNAEQGLQSVNSAVKKGSYAYFVLDRDGNVYQNFPLDRWGYHAGKSSWKGLSGTVSNELVGIEIMNAGKMEDKRDGEYYAWFTGSRDTPFSEDEVRHIKKKTDNQQKGTYQKYSEAQEEALLELVMWLKRSRPEVFDLDLVVGHDEVSPGRKNDPGGSLSMTMPDFRSKIKETYKGRY